MKYGSKYHENTRLPGELCGTEKFWFGRFSDPTHGSRKVRFAGRAAVAGLGFPKDTVLVRVKFGRDVALQRLLLLHTAISPNTLRIEHTETLAAGNQRRCTATSLRIATVSGLWHTDQKRPVLKTRFRGSCLHETRGRVFTRHGKSAAFDVAQNLCAARRQYFTGHPDAQCFRLRRIST